MTMIEKIARVIDPAPWDRFSWGMWPPAPVRKWEAKRKARRVIEMMRDMTGRMHGAMLVAHLNSKDKANTLEIIDLIWNAGIDEALSEEPAPITPEEP